MDLEEMIKKSGLTPEEYKIRQADYDKECRAKFDYLGEKMSDYDKILPSKNATCWNTVCINLLMVRSIYILDMLKDPSISNKQETLDNLYDSAIECLDIGFAEIKKKLWEGETK